MQQGIVEELYRIVARPRSTMEHLVLSRGSSIESGKVPTKTCRDLLALNISCWSNPVQLQHSMSPSRRHLSLSDTHEESQKSALHQPLKVKQLCYMFHSSRPFLGLCLSASLWLAAARRRSRTCPHAMLKSLGQRNSFPAVTEPSFESLCLWHNFAPQP